MDRRPAVRGTGRPDTDVVARDRTGGKVLYASGGHDNENNYSVATQKFEVNSIQFFMDMQTIIRDFSNILFFNSFQLTIL
jgi:hypothetical protein